MKMRYLLFVSALFLPAVAVSAQSGFIQVSGTKIYDAYGNLATGATICARPMVGGIPAGITAGSGGGQVTVQQVCQPVTSGAFTLSLPDTALTSPANACLAVQVKDSRGQIILARGYECVQPTSTITNGSWCSTTAGVTTCNFDHFKSNLPTLATVQTGPPGPTGAQGVPGPTGPSGAGVYDVSNYCTSCTLDAQIAAATSALASFPAELISTHPGHILNPITLSAGHILHLKAVTGFDAQITLNTGSGVWCDEQITHTTASTGAYLIATSGTDSPSVRGCNVLSNVGAGNNLVTMSSVTHPKVLRNTMQNGGMIYGSGMTDVDIEYNHNNGGFGVNINSVDRGLVAHNYTDAGTTGAIGIVVFNVDADPSHSTGGFNWPAIITKGHLTIDDNYEINVQSCTFLSGVLATIVSNSHCHAPVDIGLDDEGGVDNVWTGGEAEECAGNYCIGSEFETQNVMFDHIKVKGVNGHILLVAANNNNPYGQNVTFNDIDASCSGVNALCLGYVVYGYSLPVTIQNSTFHNAIITALQQAQGSTLNFKNDDFFFNFSSDFASNTANAFTAINPCQGAGGCINHSFILFDNLRLIGSNVPAGSTGIYLHHYDYNATSIYIADNNKVFGFTNGFTHSGDSGNIGATFLMHNNVTDGLITTGGTNAYFEGFHNCQQIAVCDMNVGAMGVGTTTPNTFNGYTVTDLPTFQSAGRVVSGSGEIHLINPNAPANKQDWRLQVDASGNLTIAQCNAGFTSCPSTQTYTPSH